MDEFEALLSRFEDSADKEISETEEKPLVLVVDDDASMRRGLTRSLSSRFNVLTAANGPEGLKSFQENDICSVILDVKMPGVDDFEVCMRLRRTGKPEVPVLFLTAYHSEQDLEKIDDRFQPFAFLNKGGDYDLLSHVHEAVQHYQARRNETPEKMLQ